MFGTDELSNLLTKIKTLYVSHTSNLKIHLPSGGTEGQIVKRDNSGNAVWGDQEVNLEIATSTANGLMSSNDKFKLDFTNVAYGTCTTAAETSAKVVSITGNTKWELKIGSIIIVKFTITNTASNCTLNINNTGAKSIWYNNSKYTGNSSLICGYANRYCMYVYDGTNFVWISCGVDNNTWTAFKGATASADGTAGYIPAPTKGNQDKFFRADGTWATPSTGSGTISYSATEPPVLENNMTWIGSKGD